MVNFYPLEKDWDDEPDYDNYEYDDDDEVTICEFCHGTGLDWDLMSCGECDGEGYQYWL